MVYSDKGVVSIEGREDEVFADLTLLTRKIHEELAKLTGEQVATGIINQSKKLALDKEYAEQIKSCIKTN